MINIYAYGIGFLVYIFFCLFTFDAYSRRRQETKHFALIMIYLYYSILAAYLINWVEKGFLGGNTIIVIVETAVYMVAGGLILLNYYTGTIKSREDKEKDLNDSYGNV
ncbi:MAG: hypothetical protein ACOCXG_04105 [Nanoarchaeota archaeon]